MRRAEILHAHNLLGVDALENFGNFLRFEQQGNSPLRTGISEQFHPDTPQDARASMTYAFIVRFSP